MVCGRTGLVRIVGLAVVGAALAVVAPAISQDRAPTVPSGIVLSLHEVLEDVQPDGALWLRLRYVAPDLTVDQHQRMVDDFAVLCDSQALAYTPEQGRPASQAVISIASAEVDFGASAPDITQFFEAFRLENGTCIWEIF